MKKALLMDSSSSCVLTADGECTQTGRGTLVSEGSPSSPAVCRVPVHLLHLCDEMAWLNSGGLERLVGTLLTRVQAEEPKEQGAHRGAEKQNNQSQDPSKAPQGRKPLRASLLSGHTLTMPKPSENKRDSLVTACQQVSFNSGLRQASLRRLLRPGFASAEAEAEATRSLIPSKPRISEGHSWFPSKASLSTYQC